MAASDAVYVAAGELRAGERIYLPSGAERVVERVEGPYDDGTVVVVYSTGRGSSMRIGEEWLVTRDVLQSLVPMEPATLLPAVRI